MAHSRLSITSIVDQAPDSPRGLFSSTLFQSSNVQTILPAKIRNKVNDRWDMIFVHRHHITFRELHVEATLNKARDVKEMTGCWLQQYSDKSDLDSVITGAKILRVGNDDDYNPDPGEESEHWPMPLSENWPLPVQRNPSPSPEAEQRNGRHSYPNNDPYPPNVLVLTLRRDMLDTLALLFAPEHTTSDRPNFRVVQKPMPGPGGGEYKDSLRLGAHLAVEPHGRAIAVAARETNLMFYKLKPRPAWQRAPSDTHCSADDQLEPFEEERSLPVDGTIMKIDFLQPDKSDGDTVVLLLVVSLAGKSNQLQRWDWDTTKSLQNGLQQAWPAGFPIDQRVAQPQLLIPSVLDSGFCLLAGQILARYSDVMTGHPAVSVRPMQTTVSGHDVTYASLSRDQKKWNVFARPHRYGWQGRYRTESDLLYLGREDGRIQYLELGTGSEIDVKSELMMDTPPVWVDQASDSAFAVIPRYIGDTEFVVTATGLFTIGPREEFRSRQLFCNWNPLQDFTLGRNSAYCVNGTSADQLISLQSAFTASTMLPELRLPNTGNEKRWTLFDGPSVHLVSTAGSVTEVTPLGLQSTDQPLSGDIAACIDELFERNLETVFTMQTQRGLIVQVTPDSIRVSGAKGAMQTIPISGTASTAAASSDLNGFVLLVNDNQGAYLKYLHFLDSRDSSAAIETPEYDYHDFRLEQKINPTCLAIEPCGNESLLIAISTWEDGLLLLHAEKRGAIGVVQTSAPRIPYESMTIRLSQDEILLTLGTRTGFIHFIRLDSVHNEIGSTRYAAGQQSVQLLDLDQGVLALCDGRLSLLECGILQDQVFSRRVILPQNEDKNAEGYGEREHKIAAMSPLPACFNPADRSGVALSTEAGTLVCISTLGQFQAAGEHTPVFSKKQQEDGIEQTHSIKQMSYVLPYDQYFAIPYKHVKLTPASGKASNGNKSRRSVFAMLGFHDPQSKTLLDEQNSQAIHKASGPSVQNIFEWRAQVEGSVYRLLVVHTKTPPKAQRSPRANQPGLEQGRVLIYTVDFKAKLGKQLRLQEKLKRSFPIENISIHGHDSLILAWNKQIEIITLTRKDPEDESKFQWKTRLLRTDVQSLDPVRFLRVTSFSQGNHFVHITTPKQLTIVDESHSRVWESDCRPNMGQIHLHNDDHMPVVLVLSDDGILGYTYNPNLPGTSQGRFHRNDLYALFEARLLTRITRALPHKNGWYIGSSSESSFRQFKILLENEWRLLRYLLNLAQQNQNVCPISWQDNMQFDGSPKHPLDPSRLKPKDRKTAMHINGDILRRVTAKCLQDKLIPEGKAHSSERDLSTVEARGELLRKYAEQVSPDLVKDRIFERVVEWTRTFWEPRI